MPYGYLSTKIGGVESSPYQTLMDTGSSLILVVMDAAEDLLQKSRDEIISQRDHEHSFTGVEGGTQTAYAWKTTLHLKAAQTDTFAMLIPDAIIYAVDCPNLVGYSALFGQKTGFQQRWFKQHNHSAARYWQLREWK